MQSKVTTVDQYLAELPEDRRETIQAVRAIVLKNLDRDFEEGMQYGMIGYYVPHRIYPAGYHCDPRQPLPFAGLASQKNYMSLYLMSVYGDSDHYHWFLSEWKKSGKKLDMGKSCIRFKRVEDLALDVVAESLRRVTAKKYVEFCESATRSMNRESVKTKSSAKKVKATSAGKKARATR